jgi:thymidine kinase
MVVEGEQVVVGDTDAGDEVGYEVLCRRHHMRRMTAASRDVVLQAAPADAVLLPFDDIAACPVVPRRLLTGRADPATG